MKLSLGMSYQSATSPRSTAMDARPKIKNPKKSTKKIHADFLRPKLPWIIPRWITPHFPQTPPSHISLDKLPPFNNSLHESGPPFLQIPRSKTPLLLRETEPCLTCSCAKFADGLLGAPRRRRHAWIFARSLDAWTWRFRGPFLIDENQTKCSQNQWIDYAWFTGFSWMVA